jgi:hypothetical protein
MKKLTALFVLFALVLFASCSKSSDNTPAPPNHFTVNVTVINETPNAVTINVLYGVDTGTSQTASTDLTSALFNAGTSSKTFTLDKYNYIYFLFTLANPNLQIYADSGNGTYVAYDGGYNQSMYKLLTANLTLIIKSS